MSEINNENRENDNFVDAVMNVRNEDTNMSVDTSVAGVVRPRDESATGSVRNVRPRQALVPLDMNMLTNRSMNKTKETSIPKLMLPKIQVALKNHLNCMMIRMIANKNGQKNDTLVRTYNRQQGNQKITKAQSYTRLFSVIVFENNQPTSRLAYIMEDQMNHRNMWDFSTNIRDGGIITVGTTIRLHHVKPIDKMMADDCPSLVTTRPVVVMKDHLSLNEVQVNYQVPAGVPSAFVLNKCKLEILDSEAVETGCGGLFCDKQRIREVMQYGQGCCCFRFSQRRPNMEIVHTLVIKHESLEEPLYIEEFSSTRFSLLFQTGILSCEITKESMEMTDHFYSMENKIDNGINYINANGGFTVIGWYKRGQVQDRTVLIQNENENSSRYGSSNNAPVQVDNSTIKFHPCVIRPTKKDFYKKGTVEYETVKKNKFNVDTLTNIA